MRELALTVLLVTSISPSWASAQDVDEPAVEAALLKKFKNIKRKPGLLTIITHKGPVTFKDNPVDGEGAENSFLVRSYALKSGRIDYLVITHGYEGAGYTLVNGATGNRIDLPGEPELSPSERYYVSSLIDLESGEYPNDIKIFRSSDFGVVFEKNYDDPPQPGEIHMGPDQVRWLSDTSVNVVEKSIIGVKYDKPSFHPTIVKLVNGEWIQKDTK